MIRIVLAFVLIALLQGCGTAPPTPSPSYARPPVQPQPRRTDYEAYRRVNPTIQSPILGTEFHADGRPLSGQRITYWTYQSKERFDCWTNQAGFCRVDLVRNLGIREVEYGADVTVFMRIDGTDQEIRATIPSAQFLRPVFYVTAEAARAFNKPSATESTRSVVVRRGESYLWYPDKLIDGAPYVALCLTRKGMPIGYAMRRDGQVSMTYDVGTRGCEN